nr:anti-sigma factor [Chitinophaga rhizophila]
MERYIELWAQKPPAGIKRQLMERLRKDDVQDTPAASPITTTTEKTYDDPFSEEKGEGVAPIRIWQYSAVAAIILLLASVTMNVVSYGNSDQFKDQYAEMQAEQEAINAEKQALKDELASVRKEADILKNPAFKWTRMPGMGKHTGIVATVGWNPQTKETFILAQELPEPPADKQYQLWAIVNGKPIDAGVFELGNNARVIQKVKAVENAQVFAVTLEKKGGSTSASLDQMYVAGKVAG